ncbi:hypothetical protein NVP1101O_063 [Vibrio phage 1.101.O._10N.261.45.C6]|nr:hypothetical protein NVP1101O_063 [Vibrio phage 1.101.O._10N.261.45.C6]
MRVFESKENYHYRKLKEALNHLYPNKESRKELIRIANMETEIGSFIDAGSGILLTEVEPLVDYNVQSLFIVLKNKGCAANFVDEGQCNTEDKDAWGYKKFWRSFWK